MTEDIEILRKKLLYKCNYRGCRELDYILGKLAKAKINQLTQKELILLEKFCEESENDILSWFLGREKWPEKYFNSTLYSNFLIYCNK